MKNLRNLMLVAVSGGALMALGACNNNEPAKTAPAETTAMAPAEGAAMAPATDPMVGGAAMSPNETIVANASKASNLSTLVSAVQAAGLVETLQGAGPFTVFAPTNAAFEALPAGTVDTLLKPENKDQLVSILTYHVVPGAVKSTDLTEGMTAATVQGGNVTFTLDGGAKINDAAITTADIEASNGVIHVIDKVIMPPAN